MPVVPGACSESGLILGVLLLQSRPTSRSQRRLPRLMTRLPPSFLPHFEELRVSSEKAAGDCNSKL